MKLRNKKSKIIIGSLPIPIEVIVSRIQQLIFETEIERKKEKFHKKMTMIRFNFKYTKRAFNRQSLFLLYDLVYIKMFQYLDRK